MRDRRWQRHGQYAFLTRGDPRGAGLRITAFILFAGFFLFEFVARILPSLSIDAIATDFGLSNASFGTISSVLPWIYAPMQLVLGAAPDRYRAKRLVVPVCATCETGVFLTDVAEAPMQAILRHLLTGSGASIAFVSALSVVAQVFPAEHFDAGSAHRVGTEIERSPLWSFAATRSIERVADGAGIGDRNAEFRRAAWAA